MRSVARTGWWALVLTLTVARGRPVAVIICPDVALQTAAEALSETLQVDGGYDPESLILAATADDIDRLDSDPALPEITAEDQLLVVLAGGVMRTATGEPELLARSARVPLDSLLALLLTSPASQVTMLAWLVTPDDTPQVDLAQLVPEEREPLAIVQGERRDFLTALIAGLKTLTADADRDGQVTVGELVDYATGQPSVGPVAVTARPEAARAWPLAGRGGPDVVPPLLVITSPRLRDDGPVLVYTPGPVVVTGIVADDRRVGSVQVNGIAATLHPVTDPAWHELGYPGRTFVFEAAIPIADSGFTEVEVRAQDATGNESLESFLLLAGGRAGPAPGEPEPPPSAFDQVSQVEVGWNQTEDWRYGFLVTPTVEIHGRQGRRCRTMLQFRFRPQGAWLKDIDGAFAEPGGRVAMWSDFTPQYANARVGGPPIFVPQRELHLAAGRKHALEMITTVWDIASDPPLLLATSVPVPFDLQEPAQVATVFGFQLEHNQRRDDRLGLVLRTRFQVTGMQDQPCQIAVYFQQADGRPLPDRDGRYRAGDGTVAVFEDFVPPYANADYRDYRLWIPYDQLDLAGPGEAAFRARAVIWNRGTQQALDASEWVYLKVKRDG